jgi:hypothetical protein
MDDNRKEAAIAEQRTDEIYRPRTTIGIKMTAKDKLDKNRAPG